jgi:hypothetical protein
MTRRTWSLAFLLWCGCALSAPEHGRVVSDGVAVAEFETRWNQTDLIKVHVYFPATAEGAMQPGAHPALVYVQGGFVPPARYFWLGAELARRGWVVAFPEHPLDLAFFSIENGRAAQSLLLNPPRRSLLAGAIDPTRMAVAGHSLGGVVATKLALAGGFRSVVLHASVADSADDAALSVASLPSLFLVGTNDCGASRQSFVEGWKVFPSPTALIFIHGLTHYGFTDALTEDLEKKCVSEVELDEGHRHIVELMVPFLEETTSDRVPDLSLALPVSATDAAEFR